MATGGVSSLYERLGGVYSIATVVDDFIDRIMVDPRLNANPRFMQAASSRSPGRLQIPRHGNEFPGHGGPQKYTGRSMKDSPPTSDDHGARVGSVSRRSSANSCSKFAVPQVEQSEIKAIVASTQADIVV